MLARRGGHVVCSDVDLVNARATSHATERMSAYNVTKAGMVARSEMLAAELAGSGVVVSVLCPTFVKTNIVSGGRITHGAARAARRLME
jgi:short-subunit dehydrogenase